MPLDFGTKDFYLLRADKIEARLAEIEMMSKEELEAEINSKYNLHRNKYNSFVRWDSLKLTPKRLVQIATTLGARAISMIIRNYCIDFKYWNHGMPDLILWSEEKGIAKFSEVKSESDRLSEV